MEPRPSDVILQAVHSVLDSVHFCLPGVFTAYDYKTKKANVQPTVKKHLANEQEMSLPIITNVPVIWQGTEQGLLHFEIVPGKSTCGIIFSERSLENWLSGDPTIPQSPGDPRHFSLSDAIAIPGLFSLKKSGKIAATGKGMELSWLNGYIGIDKDSLISIKNNSQNLYDVFNDIYSLLNDIISNVNWIGNLGAPIQFMPYAVDTIKVTNLQTKIKNLLQQS